MTGWLCCAAASGQCHGEPRRKAKPALRFRSSPGSKQLSTRCLRGSATDRTGGVGDDRSHIRTHSCASIFFLEALVHPQINSADK